MSAPLARHLVALREMDSFDVYAYLDYRQLLRDWFDAKKACNPRYSHRLFARKAGIKSSATLLLVIDGKRNLSPRTVEGFATAMALDEAERDFFGALVRLEQGATPKERAEALAVIMATRRFREARQLDAAALRFFTHWYLPAIRELAYRDDFSADPAWVAQTLCPPISEAEAADALDSLLALGLLAADEAGVPRPTEASVVTPHEVAHMAANEYHASMLHRAHEAIGTVASGERHILGLTAAIPESLVPEVKERLNTLQKELLHLCEQEPKERVYQLSLAFFPLSASPSESEED